MILLDTHSLLWVLADDERLGPVARASLTEASRVYSSSISVVEITIKTMLGKLSVPANYVATARDSGLRELPYTHDHALALQRFPQLARHDPFDRMLVAQAFAEGLTLLTADAVLLGLTEPFGQDSRI